MLIPHRRKSDDPVFIEVMYYTYIYNTPGRFNYHFMDSFRFFDPYPPSLLEKTEIVLKEHDNSLMEDIRKIIVHPSTADTENATAVVAEMLARHRLRVFKVYQGPRFVRFLRRARSVLLCVSFQNEEVIEAAMRGYLGRWTGTTVEVPLLPEAAVRLVRQREEAVVAAAVERVMGSRKDGDRVATSRPRVAQESNSPRQRVGGQGQGQGGGRARGSIAADPRGKAVVPKGPKRSEIGAEAFAFLASD